MSNNFVSRGGANLLLRRRMMMGMKTDIPYIKDGLLFYWDGIWNGGVGNHVSDPLSMKNIITGECITPFDDGQMIDDNSIYLTQINHICGFLTDYIPSANNFITCEICFKITGVRTVNIGGFIFAENSSLNYFETYPWGPGNNPAQWHIHYLGQNWTTPAKIAVGDIVRTYSLLGGGGSASLHENGINVGTLNRAGEYNYTGVYRFALGGYAGHIYSARIYDRKLSADELLYNHSIDMQRFNL